MAVKKIIDLEVQSNADQAIGSLRTQLRQAQQEVAALSDKFGATSKEAVEAAKRAADLKDRIGDAKALTDAFNPDAKFKALTASLSGVAGGFAAVQGAMGLFGAESSEVEKALLKVQSAMALSQGLQAVGESVDSFKQLATVVQSLSVVQKISTAAQWLWNAAMAANPIGAILTAIIAVIAAGYKLIEFFIESSEANEAAMAATKKNTQALKDQAAQSEKSTKTLQEHNKYQYDMAKASGASSEALRKLALANAREEEALAKKNAMLARSTFLRERDTLASLKANDASDEVIAAQEKLTQESWKEFTKQRDNYYKQKDAVVAVVRQQNVEVTQEQTNARKKSEEKENEAREKAREKAKQESDKAVENEKQRQQKIKDLFNKYNDEIRDITATTDAEKLELKKQADLEEINRIAKTEEEKLGLMKLYNQKYDELDAQQNEKKRLEREEELAHQFFVQQQLRDSFAQMLIESNDKILEGDLKLKEARRAALDSSLEILSGFAGKNKALAIGILAIQKGLAISDIVVNASRSIASQNANLQAANMVARATLGPVAGEAVATKNTIAFAKGVASTKLSAGVAIANVLAQGIMSAKSTLGGGDSGGSGGVGGGVGGAAPMTPQFNVVGNTGVNALANSINQQPIQAYVVAQNVTTAQSMNRNIVQSATLG